MISVYLLSQQEVAKRLNDYGCKRINERLDDETSVWVTPWGHHFLVPELGPDKVCAEYVLARIIEEEIQKTRPQNH